MAAPLTPRDVEHRRLRRLVIAAVAGLVLLSAFGLLVVKLIPADGQAGDGGPYRGSEPPGRNVLPEFDLPRYDGGRLTRASLDGQIVLLTVLDSQCEEACPILASVVAGALDRLRTSERSRVRAVAISADPAEDTPQAVRRFLANHRAAQRLDYLTGTEEQLRPLWTELSVLPSVDTGQDSMHSAPLRVYNEDGVWVSTLHAGADLSEANLLHDIRIALAREGGGASG
jgi:protein SCO1/2